MYLAMQWSVLVMVCLLRRSTCDSMTDNTWALVSNHPAWRVLQGFDCGDSAADRIIGGFNAALGQFPWIARLGYDDPYDEEKGSLDWMCGGALVTDRHVVTAAHCVKTPDYTLSAVRFGEHTTDSNPDCQHGVCAPSVQDRRVKAVHSHPKFNKPSFHNDIAVLEVEPVEINDYVTPICLPHKEQLEEPLRLGEHLAVAGWGTMNMTTEDHATILQFVSLPVVSPERCETFGKGFKLMNSEICAGAQFNKDACGGDSGGPLMKVFDTAEGPKTFLVGAVSFGPNICGIKKPGVYTSVSHFMKWILDSIVRT